MCMKQNYNENDFLFLKTKYFEKCRELYPSSANIRFCCCNPKYSHETGQTFLKSSSPAFVLKKKCVKILVGKQLRTDDN